MKWLVVFGFSVLFTPKISGQDKLIKGRVTDKLSNPIAYAHILVENESRGTTTNEDGYFQLWVHESAQMINFLVSSIGYHMIDTTFLASKRPIIIKMDEEVLLLEEVVVSNLSPKEIVKVAYERMGENHNLEAHTLSGYYKEYEKSNDKIHYLAEAATFSYLPRKKSKEKVKVHHLKARKATFSNLDSVGVTLTIGGAYDLVEHAMFTDIPPIVPSRIDKFSYSISGYVKGEFGNEIAIIEFEKNKSYFGKLYIDLSSYAFVRIEYTNIPKSGWIFNDWKWTKIRLVEQYQKDKDGLMYLSFSRYEGDWINKKNKEKFTYEAFYATTKVNAKNEISNQMKIFSRKDEFYTSIDLNDEDFWKGYDYVPLNKKEMESVAGLPIEE